MTQSAQVREIDHEIYKYVGVSGVDRNRIVQVGNAPAFDEQDVLSNAYTSPVMTAVMAAFGEPELLRNTYTSRLVEIDIVLEGILGQQMIVQATLVDYFIADAEEGRVDDRGDPQETEPHRGLHHDRRDSRCDSGRRSGLQQRWVVPTEPLACRPADRQ